MRRRTAAGAALFAVLAACGDMDDEANAQEGPDVPTRGALECSVASGGARLPAEVRETSGLARGLTHGHLWTHNDANNPAVLYALDEEGRPTQRVEIVGASNTDWEDIAAGPCGTGACLYVGDIGDNDGTRDYTTIHVIPEPAPGVSSAQATAALHARYPGGPTDAEGLFVGASGDIYIVTKGRSGPVELYRYPQPHRPGEIVTLERIRELFPRPEGRERISGATMSPDGRWVAIRNYTTMFVYRAAELLDGSAEAVPFTVDLRPLGHVQGESVALGSDGSVWVTSEAENRSGAPVSGRMSCTLPEE